MTSFKTAIKAGIESAELARTKKNEIQSLFDTLATDVEETFDQNVRLFLKRQFKPAEEHPFGIGRAIQEAIGSKGRYYMGIMVSHVDKDGEARNPVELGEWKVNDDGYPVTLSYSGKSSVCDNKDELFDALTDFISNTSIAEQLKQAADTE